MLLVIIAIFLFVSPVNASRGITISADKSSLLGGEEMLINASASGFASSEAIFVKGAFFKEGESNYFGLTKTGDNWIKNSEPSENQLKVDVANWDGKLNIKSDYTDSGFKGSGGYKLKVGFYYITSGGNTSSVNWSSNILDVNLIAPTPTPTQSPTPTPTISPSPSPSKTASTTPTPTANIIQKSPLSRPIESIEITISPSPLVLGSKIEESIPSPSPIVLENKDTKKPAIFAYGLIFLGISFIVPSIYLSLKASN